MKKVTPPKARRRLGDTHVDHELRIGSLAHYADPAYYDHAYAERRHDVEYYAALAQASGGPVLEYGCGSGRITLAMARAGCAVVGVDHSDPMLSALRSALTKESVAVRSRVTLCRGDMRSLRISRRFPLVISPFNTFLHLYTREDVARHLDCVRTHLAPHARFVFDVSLPAPADLAREPGRAYRMPAFRHPTLGVRTRYLERFEYDPIRQILFVSMEFEPRGLAPFVTPLCHRQFFPAELEALLDCNGFEVRERQGGFRGEPVDRHTDSMVWVTRTRRRQTARPKTV